MASEGVEDWALAHVRMFAFLGGVPKAVVAKFVKSGNLKAAVIKADRFDPGLNRLKPRWRCIMARRSCQPGRANRVS